MWPCPGHKAAGNLGFSMQNNFANFATALKQVFSLSTAKKIHDNQTRVITVINNTEVTVALQCNKCLSLQKRKLYELHDTLNCRSKNLYI